MKEKRVLSVTFVYSVCKFKVFVGRFWFTYNVCSILIFIFLFTFFTIFFWYWIKVVNSLDIKFCKTEVHSSYGPIIIKPCNRWFIIDSKVSASVVHDTPIIVRSVVHDCVMVHFLKIRFSAFLNIFPVNFDIVIPIRP